MSILTSHGILALTVVALWAKGIVMSLCQVVIRVRSKRYGRPEDAQMMGYAPEAEDERIKRLSSAWRNEFEATPAFLALAFVHVLSGGTAHPFWLVCLCFVAGRFAQGWAQFTLRQPQRTIAFLFGMAASIAMAVLVLMDTLGYDQ
jgi:uncharacterized MAPEG superfamily protein